MQILLLLFIDNTANTNSGVSANNYSEPSSNINQSINQTNLTSLNIGNNSSKKKITNIIM